MFISYPKFFTFYLYIIIVGILYLIYNKYFLLEKYNHKNDNGLFMQKHSVFRYINIYSFQLLSKFINFHIITLK